MVVCISTGCCYNLNLRSLEAIHWLEQFKSLIDGIELLFALPNELLEFEFDEKALSFLKSLKFTSIHMPFKEVEYADNKETKELIAKGEKLGKEINARYLLFHPQTVKDFTAIKASIPVCIENMNKKIENKGCQTVEDITSLLTKHSFLNLVLDTSHAISNNIKLNNFFTLKNRLKAIHVSVQWQREEKLKEHGFTIEAKPEQLAEIEKISILGAPKIIEANFYPEKVSLIEKEIKFLKTLRPRELPQPDLNSSKQAFFYMIAEANKISKSGKRPDKQEVMLLTRAITTWIVNENQTELLPPDRNISNQKIAEFLDALDKINDERAELTIEIIEKIILFALEKLLGIFFPLATIITAGITLLTKEDKHILNTTLASELKQEEFGQSKTFEELGVISELAIIFKDCIEIVKIVRRIQQRIEFDQKKQQLRDAATTATINKRTDSKQFEQMYRNNRAKPIRVAEGGFTKDGRRAKIRSHRRSAPRERKPKPYFAKKQPYFII